MRRLDLTARLFLLCWLPLFAVCATGCGATPRDKVLSIDKTFDAAIVSVNHAYSAKLIDDERMVRIRVLANAADEARRRLKAELPAIESGADRDTFDLYLDLATTALRALLVEQQQGN